MGKLLLILFSSGPESQNIDTVYELARAAVASGHNVTVFCDADASYSLVAKQFHSEKITAAHKMTYLIEHGVQVLVCHESARLRGIDTKKDFVKGVVNSSLGGLTELMGQYDRIAAFGSSGTWFSMANAVLLVFKGSSKEEGVAEGLRVATAMIAMDVLPQLLFVDDGVFWLIKKKLDKLSNPSVKERLQTISDLVGLQVLSDSLAQRKLKPNDLDQCFSARILSLDDAAELIRQYDAVIAF